MSDPVPMDLQAYDRSLARKRMGAGACCSSTPAGGCCWWIPSTRTPGRSPGVPSTPTSPPGRAAVREVREELGLELPLGRLLVVDWVPPDPRYSADRLMSEGVMTVFDGGVLTAEQIAAIVPQREELRGYAFVPPERLHEFLNDRLTRRVRACLRARDTGTALYIENGSDPGPT
ncbi:NUDIX domain-containing protein [Streptacidiphilus sp. PAMC 29251]